MWRFHLFFIVLCSLQQLHKAAPDAETYLNLGYQALLAEKHEKAIELYGKGIEFVQNSKDDEISLVTILSLYTNLATALSAQGRHEAAADSYQKGLLAYKDTIPEIVDKAMHQEATLIAAQNAFFLGMVYQDLKQTRDAIDSYTYANKLDPMHWASLANLGSVLHDQLSDHSRALEAYNQAYSILTTKSNIEGQEPRDPPLEPRFILSQLQYRIGLCLNQDPTRECVIQEAERDSNDNIVSTPVECRQLAANAFSLAVKYDDTNELAKHMLATVTADATMERASNAYITSLFDDYATNFEHSLVEELRYTGYERLRKGFDRAFKNGEHPVMDLVVDAGCGTGLAGEQFRNVSKNLTGVDLSAVILNQAEKLRPGLYNETRVGDVIDVFRELKDRISLIVAADSYIYFGNLVPLFQAMHEGLHNRGYAAFTLENVDAETEKVVNESKPDWRWQLTASGRFAHRQSYVEAVVEQSHLRVLHYEALDGFRYEQGSAVRGHMFVLQKISDESNDEL